MTSPQKSSFFLMLVICSTISFSLPQLRQPTSPSNPQPGLQLRPYSTLTASTPQPALQSRPSPYPIAEVPPTTRAGILNTPVSSLLPNWLRKWLQEHFSPQTARAPAPSAQLAVAPEAQADCTFPQVANEGDYNNIAAPSRDMQLKGKLKGQGKVMYKCVVAPTGSSTVSRWVRVGSDALLYDRKDRVVARYHAVDTTGLQRRRTATIINQKDNRVALEGMEVERGPRTSDLDPAAIEPQDENGSRTVYRLKNKGGRLLSQSCTTNGAEKGVDFQAEFWLYASPRSSGFPGLTDGDAVRMVCASGSRHTSPT